MASREPDEIGGVAAPPVMQPSAPLASPTRLRVSDHSLVQLTLVRFREFVREPEAVFWTFVFPVLLAAGLGVAFRNRPAEVTQVGVVMAAPDAAALAATLERQPELSAEVLDDSAAAHALRTGRVALIAIPRAGGGVEYRYDEERPEGRTARLLADAALQRAAGRRDPVPVVERHVSERGSRYIDFVIPGLLGLNLMGSGIWGLGFGIVDARRKKLLKRLIATPMSRVQYLASFMLSRLILLVGEVAALVGFGVLVFAVPVRGTLIELGVLCLLSALTFSGLGLLVASRAKTMEGVSGLMNLVMLPMWIFSGVFFSANNFPAAAQPFIQALPLTAVNDALRAHMLEGAGLVAIAGELAVIVAWTVGSFFLALQLFRWR
jgi:ABC-2 type transport system permease protein